MTQEQRPGIVTLNGGTYTPYRYPEGIRTEFPDDLLAETERWASLTIAAGAILHYYRGDPDSRKLYLTWLTTLAGREERKVEAFIDSLPRRAIDSLPDGSWQLQRNTGGMYTCQLASAANALNFLYPESPRPYTEEDVLNVLGGRQYAAVNTNGVEVKEIIRAMQQLASHINVRRTNSVVEMLKSVENGAAVMFPLTNNHEALIPPGHRIQREPSGQIYVQIADPMSREARRIPVVRLIKSEITVVIDPEQIENNVLIIERGINSIGQSRIVNIDHGIRSVPQDWPRRIVSLQ